MLKTPFVARLRLRAVHLRDRAACAVTIAAAVARLAQPTLGRRAAVALGLVAVARADRYEITNFYLPMVLYAWRAPNEGSHAPSIATATTDEDFAAGSVARFALHTEDGATLAEWHGPRARALLALGRFAGRREDSPHRGPGERFAFEFAQEAPVAVA